MLRCVEGIRIDKLPIEVLDMLMVIAFKARANNRNVVITGKDDMSYRRGGAHSRGYAVDFRANSDIESEKRFWSDVKRDLEEKRYQVEMMFGDNGHRDHVHIHIVNGTEAGF